MRGDVWSIVFSGGHGKKRFEISMHKNDTSIVERKRERTGEWERIESEGSEVERSLLPLGFGMGQ